MSPDPSHKTWAERSEELQRMAKAELDLHGIPCGNHEHRCPELDKQKAARWCKQKIANEELPEKEGRDAR